MTQINNKNKNKQYTNRPTKRTIRSGSAEAKNSVHSWYYCIPNCMVPRISQWPFWMPIWQPVSSCFHNRLTNMLPFMLFYDLSISSVTIVWMQHQRGALHIVSYTANRRHSTIVFRVASRSRPTAHRPTVDYCTVDLLLSWRLLASRAAYHR